MLLFEIKKAYSFQLVVISANVGKNSSSEICLAPGSSEIQDKCPANTGVNWLTMFVISMIVIGIGFSPAVPLAAVYFQDNTAPEKATLCLSMFMLATCSL